MNLVRQFTTDSALFAMQVIGVLALVCVATDAARERVVAIGDQAPEFSITTDDGRKLGRDNFGGNLLVINFWATWCPPCVFEMPSLSEFARNLRSRGVIVLAVGIDDQDPSYTQFLQRLQPSFFTTRDGGSELASAFGTGQIPETYVIDRHGRLLQKYVNARDWMDPAILNDVQALLQ